jgi:N-acetylglutamate synthase-like GNAT family acetyltransferase
MRIQIICYKAIDHQDLCLDYQNGHIGVLSNLGIKMISSSKEEWMSNPNMYFSLIYLGDKVVGGARLQIKDASCKLPIEDAIDYLDKGIIAEVAARSNNLTGEACGLWIGDEVRNIKMGLVLTRCVIIMARLLELKSLFVLTSQYSSSMTRQCGFTPMTTLGKNGTFEYPNEQFLSTVCVIDDLQGLVSAEKDQKRIIDHLAANRQGQLIESTEKGPITIEYNFLNILS